MDLTACYEGTQGAAHRRRDGDDFHRFLDRTTSGGVLRNDGLLHATLTNAPCGGVGGSGSWA